MKSSMTQKHPYTWGLLSSMPDLTTSNDTELIAIPGTPPDLLHPPKGDALQVEVNML